MVSWADTWLSWPCGFLGGGYFAFCCFCFQPFTFLMCFPRGFLSLLWFPALQCMKNPCWSQVCLSPRSLHIWT